MDFAGIVLHRDGKAVLSSLYHDILFLLCFFFFFFVFLLCFMLLMSIQYCYFLQVETFFLLFSLEKASLIHHGFYHFLFAYKVTCC